MAAESPIGKLAMAPAVTWRLTLLLTICFTLSYADRHVLSLLVQSVKTSLALSDTQIGLAQGLAFSIFYVLASLPLARLIDSGHRPRIIGACIAAWCVATSLCGAAQNFWHLMIARIGVASSEAGLPPAALTLLADRTDARGLAKANSVFMLAPYLGGGLALTGGGALYAWAERWVPHVIGPGIEPWRVVFVLVGLPGLLAALAVLAVHEPRIQSRIAKVRPIKGELLRFLRTDPGFFGRYMLTIALHVMTLNAIVSWMPAVMMRSFGLDAKGAGLMFGPIFLLSGVLGTIGAGLIIARTGRGSVPSMLRLMRVCAAVAVLSSALGPLAPTVVMQLSVVAVTLVCVSAVNSLSALPLLLISPTHVRAQAVALIGLVAALVGTGMGPILVGVLSDHATTWAARPLAMALSIVGFTATLLASVMLRSLVRRTPAGDVSAS